VSSCQEIAGSFPPIQDYLCAECRDHFARLRVCLDLYGLRYRVEPRLVRGLDYYTKTTFEIVSPGLGAQNSLLGGGRYDDMMKDFGGPEICGTGFAMGMERVLSVAHFALTGRKVLYLAFLGGEARKTGIELARFFRANGIECLLEFKDRGMKAHFARANKLQAAWVLIVGEDEIAKGRFGLKEMATGCQVDGTREELLRILRGN
jgi:histidyl-tRNA synthetase